MLWLHGTERGVCTSTSTSLPARSSEITFMTLSRSDAVLAVIGPGWLHAASRDGERRMDDPDDLVRSELRTALSLGKALVPVLVGGAVAPPRSLLPDDISALAYLKPSTLGDATWTQDVSLLIRRLNGEAGSRWMRWLPWKR
jgi:hypothetical protein